MEICNRQNLGMYSDEIWFEWTLMPGLITFSGTEAEKSFRVTLLTCFGAFGGNALNEFASVFEYTGRKAELRANTCLCPRLSATIFVCAENVVKNGSFCIMANLMLYIGTHSIGTCASLLHIIIIIIIKPLLKIFNECRSLTGVGELNAYLRSSMNAEV